MDDINYAVRVDDGVVTQALVGTAEWASNEFGGTWVNSSQKVWIGGTWTEEEGFRPPKPSPDCWWENDQWICPQPEIPEI